MQNFAQLRLRAHKQTLIKEKKVQLGEKRGGSGKKKNLFTANVLICLTFTIFFYPICRKVGSAGCANINLSGLFFSTRAMDFTEKEGLLLICFILKRVNHFLTAIFAQHCCYVEKLFRDHQ